MSRLTTHDAAARWVEGDLTDRLQLCRDRGGPTDDAVDPVTFRLVPAADDLVSLHIGAGMLHAQIREGRSDEGERVAQRGLWRVRMELAFPAPAIGDIIVVLASELNPTFVGKRVKVTALLGHSMGVSRIVRAEDVTAATVR